MITGSKVVNVDEMSVDCWNGLISNTPSVECLHMGVKDEDNIHMSYTNDTMDDEDNIHMSYTNDTVDDDCDGNTSNHISGSDDSGVDTTSAVTEIACDYCSVRDDESIIYEGLLPYSRDDDDNKPFDQDNTNVNNDISISSFANNENCSNKEITSLSENVSSYSVPVECPVETVDVFFGDAVSQNGTAVSVAVPDSERLMLDQTKEEPQCLLVVDQSIDVTQPLHKTCMPSSFLPFSPLPPPTHSERQFSPISCIGIDEKPPPKELDTACVIDMNILQKTDLSNVTAHFAERCDSQLSTVSEKQDICRICHCEGDPTNKLISPCLCSGSLKYIHLSCLQKWIKSSDKKSCELCNFDYIMTMKTRPFKQWEKLDMTLAERRKIVCSVTFHVIAITCVIWSLYVLIDRTTEEVNSGTLDWPFWTKLIVVAIGFTGGLVFMYVQCKMYLQLCLRWRQFNKLISIENSPDDPQFRTEAAARIKARSNEAGGVVNTVALQEVDSF